MKNLTQNRKTTKVTLLSLAAVAVVLGVGLVMMSVAGDREVSASSGGGTAGMEAVEIDSSADHAKALFACKVEDINDTAAVAKLLETMGLEEAIGKYTVEIAADDEGEEDDGKVLTLTVTDSVQKTDKKTFDANMQKYAQQLLALIPDIHRAEWQYTFASEEAQQEKAIVSLDEAAATEELGTDVRDFGKSEKKLLALLQQQAEE